MISNKVYDTIKLVALIGAPVIVFLSALCNIWAVPHAAELTATLAAIDTLIGAIVTALKADYDRRNAVPED
jgi:small basic protein